MDGQIGHLHQRYRLVGGREACPGAAARLDSMARGPLAAALGEALDRALAGDPTVYVLRRVHADVALNLGSVPSDAQVADRLARHMARATVHQLAYGPDDDRDLVRFADQAEYVARFVADLLRGRAQRCWFYFPFLRAAGDPPAQTVLRALMDNRDHLPAILGHLHELGSVGALLSALDGAALETVWSEGLGAEGRAAPASIRPLFAAALSLLEQLGVWQGLAQEDESLFEAYLATGPLAADWQDRRQLAAVVIDAVRFLVDRRALVLEAATLAPRLEQALAGLDWLDTAWLGESLLAPKAEQSRPPPDLPPRPTGLEPTPRQRELLAGLRAALATCRAALDHAQPACRSNALRLYAALVSREPRWAGEPLSTAIIDQLLSAWGWLASSSAPAETLDHLRRRDFARVLHSLPRGAQEGAGRTFRGLVALGEPGLELVADLMNVGPRATGDASKAGRLGAPVAARQAGDASIAVRTGTPGAARQIGDVGWAQSIETGCAGVFLLLRAMLDVRLPWLVRESSLVGDGKLAALPAMLLALGLRWAGEAGLAGGQIDAGLGVLAGLDQPPAIGAVIDVWSHAGPDQLAAFQAGLLRILAGQRLVDATLLHLHRLPLDGGGPALVAGDGSAYIWPLTRLVGRSEIAGVVHGWLELWQGATGHRPAVVAWGSLLAELDDDLGAEALAVPEAGDREAGGPPAAYRAAEAALLAALGALDGGRLGLPEADLVLGLAAVALLRAWARWLGPFATSSVPYLLANWVRRPGRLRLSPDTLQVDLEGRPLDLVLEMAGYTADLAMVPWLARSQVRFRRQEA
jgi:hypothetical protein